MRRTTTLARFPRGLVSDEARPDALLQADDVLPLRGKAGWRTRGGKPQIAVVSSFTNFALFPPPPDALMGGLLVSTQVSATRGVSWWDGVATSFVTMASQPLNAAGTALTFAGNINIYSSFDEGNFALFNGELLCAPLNTRLPVRWGGVPPAAPNPTAEYTTGTVATTQGSTTVTGTSTVWTTNATVGQFIWIANAPERAFRIVAVNSNTSITVDRPLPATGSGQTYRIVFNTWWSVKAGTFGGPNLAPTVPLTANSVMGATSVCTHAGRVFVGSTCEASNNLTAPHRLRWCATSLETDALFGGSGAWGGAEYFHPNAYLDVDPGDGGSGIRALASFGGSLFIFKANAVYIMRGDVETDGRDVGASIDTIMRGDGLYWGKSNGNQSAPVVTPYGIVFVGQKGLYLLTPTGVTNLTDKAGLTDFYTSNYIGGDGGFTSPTKGPRMLAWLGDRLVLQGASYRAQAVANGVPNTLVWYPSLDVWVTQTTVLCGIPRLVNGFNVVVPNRWIAMASGEINPLFGKMTIWDGDYDFTSYSQAQRAETPLMKLTSHPVPLQVAMNGRLRTLLLKAKLVDDAATTPTLTAKVLLGEQGYDTGVEGAISASSSRGAVSAQTEKWSRHQVRAGTPPVDTVRYQLVQAGGALDCRFYQSGVEYVSVNRQR